MGLPVPSAMWWLIFFCHAFYFSSKAWFYRHFSCTKHNAMIPIPMVTSYYWQCHDVIIYLPRNDGAKMLSHPGPLACLSRGDVVPKRSQRLLTGLSWWDDVSRKVIIYLPRNDGAKMLSHPGDTRTSTKESAFPSWLIVPTLMSGPQHT